jgi:hypothetical protein
MTNICDVCGKVEECKVVCSCFGAYSYAICDECLAAGKEHYKGMVHYIACAGRFPDEINPGYQAIVREQLKLHNKTEEEFIADVDRSINEMYAMFSL